MSDRPRSGTVRRVASLSLKRFSGRPNKRSKPKETIIRENIHSARSEASVMNICDYEYEESPPQESRIEIIKQIGSGGAGKVYSAYVDGMSLLSSWVSSLTF